MRAPTAVPFRVAPLQGKAWRNGRVRRARSSSGEGEAAAEWDPCVACHSLRVSLQIHHTRELGY